MITYEFWLQQILDISKNIGDRAGQEEQWLSTPEENSAAAKAGRPCIWDPGELYCMLFDDFAFEPFMAEHANTFSEAQGSAGRSFLTALNAYRPEQFNELSASFVALDPEWQIVRDAANSFVASFERSESSTVPEEQTLKEQENT